MTVIAWDGKTLAGDKLSAHGGTPMPTTKVHRIPRIEDGEETGTLLVGCAGRVDYIEAFLGWMRGKPQPSFPDNAEFSALSINEQGQAFAIGPILVWYPISLEKWAIGSGCEYALGAMACGATAEEAVRIASELDINCGLGVDVLTLEPGNRAP